jgi:hypothetical protein
MSSTGIFLPLPLWLIWLVLFASILGAMALVGRRITGHARGFLLDRRKKYSLSQLQIVVWTLVLMPSLATIVLAYGTMSITISGDLLALMGISAASLGGSLIIKDYQADSPPEPTTKAVPDGVVNEGRLAANVEDTRARWSDMFRAEILEDSLNNKLDFGKFQLFLVTLVAVSGYVLVLFNQGFTHNGASYALPELSAGVVSLIGISHAGYLGIKTAQ